MRLLLLVLEVLEVAVHVRHFVDAVLDKVLVRLLESRASRASLCPSSAGSRDN